jgi:hypothetical protein
MALFRGTSAGGPTSPAVPEQKINLGQLNTLIEFFPIGKKVSYCPEYTKEVVFDTLVVGYCVNGKLLYSGGAIDRDAEGHVAMFRTADNDEPIPVSRLKLFQMLVPDTTELEGKLDYGRRALIGRGRQFTKGNSISLISRAGAKGVSSVDTEVAKRLVLPDGPYAAAKMILLTPELRSLLVTDQRGKARAKTSVPVSISFLDGKRSGSYIIADVSDGAMRIRGGDGNKTIPPMERGDEVILEIDLGEVERHYTIKGSVFRQSSVFFVIQLDGLLKDGVLTSFSQLDFLELKAGVLNYGV